MTLPNDSDQFEAYRSSPILTTFWIWFARVSIPLVALVGIAGVLYYAGTVELATRLAAEANYSKQFGVLFGRGDQPSIRATQNPAPAAPATHVESMKSLTTMLAAGGFTFDPVKNQVSPTGIALSIFPDRGRVFESIKDVTPGEIFQFLIDNESIWATRSDVYVGGWYNRKTDARPEGNNKVYLDLIVVVESEENARELGKKHGQLAGFNLATGATIPIMTEQDQAQWEKENRVQKNKNNRRESGPDDRGATDSSPSSL